MKLRTCMQFKYLCRTCGAYSFNHLHGSPRKPATACHWCGKDGLVFISRTLIRGPWFMQSGPSRPSWKTWEQLRLWYEYEQVRIYCARCGYYNLLVSKLLSEDELTCFWCGKSGATQSSRCKVESRYLVNFGVGDPEKPTGDWISGGRRDTGKSTGRPRKDAEKGPTPADKWRSYEAADNDDALDDSSELDADLALHEV